jgi:hypothetical protein
MSATGAIFDGAGEIFSDHSIRFWNISCDLALRVAGA